MTTRNGRRGKRTLAQTAMAEYAIASAECHLNPQAIFDNILPDDNAQRMERLDTAERRMMRFAGRPCTPYELAEYAKAEADKGCCSCWCSSNKATNHPECQRKIDHWFRCRERLREEGMALALDERFGPPLLRRVTEVRPAKGGGRKRT